MTPNPCPRETEVGDLLRSGYWPGACGPELHSHMDICSQCSDLVLVTRTLQRARAASMSAARLDAPGILWWRAQLRRRSAAVERMNKPIVSAHGFALLINLLVAAALALSLARHGFRGLSWRPVFHLQTLWAFASTRHDWNLILVISCLGATALLAGVALYLASDRP